MNAKPRIVLLVAGLAGLSSFAFAADAATEKSSEKRTLRMIHVSADAKEKGTFLGVETAPVPPVVSAQLGLVEGTGLVVRSIVPDSPAAGVLQVHDLLLKLDDQVLIEIRQLAVLVRGKKPGEEVALQILRAGKTQTVKVKLAEREMPRRLMMHEGGPGLMEERLRIPGSGQHGSWTQGSEETMDMLHALDEARRGQARVHVFERRVPGPGGAAEINIVNTENSRFVLRDESGTLELSLAEGKKTLVAKGTDGKVIHEGPVDTPEQREALPAELRKRLERMEGMEGFRMPEARELPRTRMRVISPGPEKVALPPRVIEERRGQPVI
jgi:serine protease Do